MKVKQFLCLLAIVPFIFFSCGKEDSDYRDGYEGTYATNITGSLTIVNTGVSFPIDAYDDIVVKKLGSKELKFTNAGESMIVTVDKEGNFTVPAESASQTQTDPETGAQVTMNLTGSGFGSITNKTLYIKETYWGSAVLEVNGEVDYSTVSGTIVYNGNKKSNSRR